MPTLDAAPLPTSIDLPVIRRIGASDLNWALTEGWRDFLEKRGDLIFIGLLYPVICLVTVVVTFNDPLLPLFFPLVAGLSIAGPAVASGFYELARRKEEGRDSTWWHFLDPLTGRSRMPLAVLTAGLAALFIGWLVVAYAIYAVTFGGDAPLTIADFAGRPVHHARRMGADRARQPGGARLRDRDAGFCCRLVPDGGRQAGRRGRRDANLVGGGPAQST